MSDSESQTGGQRWVHLRDSRGVYTARPAQAEITDGVEAHYRAASRFLARCVERGEAPWMIARDASHVPPQNLSGTPYTGANAIWLQATADRRGYSDPRWGSASTVEAAGGRVRDGEPPSARLYWRFAGRDDTTGESWPTRVFRYGVYNAEQCTGLPPHRNRGSVWVAHPRPERILAVPRLVESTDGQARYDLARDRIELPPADRFADRAAYHRTALHEVGHWTGHPDRLDRPSLVRGLADGHDSRAYAREELGAEIHAYLTGSRMGLGHDPARHTRFASAWARELTDDPRAIYRAAYSAERISRYVTVRMPTMEPVRPESASERGPERALAEPERDPGRGR